MSDMLIKQLSAKIRNLFSHGTFQKRYSDGKIQVKTLSGRVLEQKEAFPYGLAAKAKTGRVLVFCQGGNFNGFEILPVIADDTIEPPKLDECDVALYTNDNGRIKIAANGSGKIFIGNSITNMFSVITGIIDEISNAATIGSSTSHVMDPATKLRLANLKNTINQLFEECT